MVPSLVSLLVGALEEGLAGVPTAPEERFPARAPGLGTPPEPSIWRAVAGKKTITAIVLAVVIYGVLEPVGVAFDPSWEWWWVTFGIAWAAVAAVAYPMQKRRWTRALEFSDALFNAPEALAAGLPVAAPSPHPAVIFQSDGPTRYRAAFERYATEAAPHVDAEDVALIGLVAGTQAGECTLNAVYHGYLWVLFEAPQLPEIIPDEEAGPFADEALREAGRLRRLLDDHPSVALKRRLGVARAAFDADRFDWGVGIAFRHALRAAGATVDA